MEMRMLLGLTRFLLQPFTFIVFTHKRLSAITTGLQIKKQTAFNLVQMCIGFIIVYLSVCLPLF